MVQTRKFLPVLIVLLSMACGLVSKSISATESPMPTEPIPTMVNSSPENTSVPRPPATDSSTQVPLETPSATQDLYAQTMAAIVSPMMILQNISQFYHPVGTPLSSWHSVPVMPQAIAGQEFQPYVYSYTAKGTLDLVKQFYTSKAPSLGLTDPPLTGSAGSGMQANHSIDFISVNLVIVLTSFDNDTGHVIVVISKTP